MVHKKDPSDAYVHKVREDTHNYMAGLLAENKRLGELIVALEAEKIHLEAQIRGMREELDLYHMEGAKLKKELAQFEENNRRFSEQYVEVETQNNNLANLYVASHRLHGSVERKEVFDAIREIVSNLIGSEEFGIFERDRDATAFSLVSSMGIDEDRYKTLPAKEGVIAQVVRSGEIFVSTSSPMVAGADHVTACIPLILKGNVIGAIVIFRLLPQKSGLESVDQELFQLLGTQAATAMYCTKLHAQAVASAGSARS